MGKASATRKIIQAGRSIDAFVHMRGCLLDQRAQNYGSEVFGVVKKAADGGKYGGSSTAPGHSSVHGCSPRKATAVPAKNKF